MTVNTENLYDSSHDQGFFDYTFLPLSHQDKKEQCETLSSSYYRNLCLNLNWTKKAMKLRLKQFRKVLQQTGSLPDVLAVQEVENQYVVDQLAETLGYENSLATNQDSKRGIDVGLLWSEKSLHYISATEVPAPLRSPLRVHFKVKNTQDNLYVYVNHWPSQLAPLHFRINSARAVEQDFRKIKKRDPKAQSVVLGDFNVTKEEESEVFAGFSKGRKALFTDVHSFIKNKYPKHIDQFPKGTYFHWLKNEWHRFDRIFVSKNLLRGKKRLRPLTYRIETHRENSLSDKELSDHPVPLGYNFLMEKETPLGFSDHFPVSAEIEFKN